MIVRPFRGLRPREDLAARIPSPPYDVVSTDEARRIVSDEPHSFLRVVRPEVDLDPAIDPHDDRVYLQGRENFVAMVREGWLVRDPKASYYVYRLTIGDHTQTGIAGAAAVDDYRDGRIKKHEHTRPDKENDRVRVVETLEAYPGPVFLTHAPQAGLGRQVAAVVSSDPEVRFKAPDGVEHALWVVSDEARVQAIEAAFSEIPATYVADGHHRAAAAARVADGRAGTDARSFLAVHFPSDQLRVLDYNRVVSDLAGLGPAELLDAMQGAGFRVTRNHADRRPPGPGAFGLYLDGSWSLIEIGPEVEVSAELPERLDVSVLTTELLQPLLGIGDVRTDPRIDFVGGIRGMDELERRVDDGRAAVAFALYPTSIEDVMRVADAGRVMPPKSTWFEPKLRSGLVVQTI